MMKKINSANLFRQLTLRSLTSVIFCILMYPQTPAQATPKDDLRAESIQIAEQYANGEISEKTAIEKLDEIIRKIQALEEKPAVTRISEEKVAAPQVFKEKIAAPQVKTSSELSKTEELAGSIVLRKAILPSLSPVGIIWSLLKPILWFFGFILFILGIAVAVYGLHRVHSWCQILRRRLGNLGNIQNSRDIRSHAIPSPPPPRPPSSTNQTTRRIITNPPPREPLHSGEVPNHLT
jgi:hypothetical protein